jgi:FixJ family two-component response regulator
MENRLVIHVVDGDCGSRAEHARLVLSLGHHPEVYADLDELLDRPPEHGVVLVRQNAAGCDVEALFRRLGEESIWLPVIVAATDPGPAQIVAAIKSGALDFLPLPIAPGHLARSLGRVMDQAAVHGRAHQVLAEARCKVGTLSRREREVLEWLSLGCSNKVIARELGISPRTVEIHRANMMVKLGARHAAEAIRVWLQADLESTIKPDEQALEKCRSRRSADGHFGAGRS